MPKQAARERHYWLTGRLAFLAVDIANLAVLRPLGVAVLALVADITGQLCDAVDR